ncbi:MAG: hypothetical protein ACNYWU_12380 [Desulfobacterales bacterium]
MFCLKPQFEHKKCGSNVKNGPFHGAAKSPLTKIIIACKKELFAGV